MSTIQIDRYPALGAEILGVDTARLLEDDDLPALVLDALEDNGVVVFRDLRLDDETQVAFCRRLGDIVELPGSELPGIFRVSLDPDISPMAAYLRGTFDWHIDGATVKEAPVKATVLTAHAVAEVGGETEFASTYAAYDNLTDDEKDRFESVRVLHSVEATLRLPNPNPTPDEEAVWRELPRTEHPLVWRHRSGRRSLVLGATALSIVGMEFDEGRALLAELLDRSTAPDRVYRHEWSVGDTVIWDNRGVLHRALPYADKSPRDMHRTTLVGDETIS
jgi:alpha-ketoglutarate-dependent taurine dioxygenase